MKRKLLLVCLLAVTTVAFAQQKRIAEMPKQNTVKYAANIGVTVPVVTPSSSAAAPLPIWSDDFSNVTNWVIGHDPTACSLDWQVGQNLSCQGSYPINDILSTTASNGYALIDSDFYGGATGGTEVEDSWLTMATPVDLNGYPYVNVEFETNYRSYNAEKAYIVVGIGDGQGNVTWPDLDPNSGTAASNVFAPFDSYASSDATTNPQLMSVNISSALVGLTPTELADIYIRFHWTGTWGYAWFVDDVAIIETPEHELRFGAETFGGWWIGYDLTLGAGTDYTFYPMSQAIAQPYRLEGVISSTGIQTQNNSTMHVDIDENGTITSRSSNPSSLSSGQNDTTETTASFTPINYGYHQMNFWATSDSFPTTDTIGRGTIVTDTIYGVDYDWNSDGANASGYAYLSRPNCGQVLANVFDIFANTTLTSISFHVSDQSVAGANVTVEVYEEDATADPIFLDQSSSYELQPSDIGNWVTISLTYQLLAGTSYLAGVRGQAHPLDTVGISSSGNDHSTGYIQDNGCDIGTGASGSWYSSSARLIRMNTTGGGINSVNDIEQKSLFNVYPNPTNGIFVIELEENSKYEVTVNNVLGQTVYATSINDMKTTIDLSSFEKGLYTIELKNNKTTYTEKVIIE